MAADIEAVLDDAAGASAFSVKDSGSVAGAYIDSDGNMVVKGGMRLDSAGVECATAENLIVDGNIGIGTTAPGSALDVKGTLRFSGATSGYVGLAPAAAAGSTTYTLPSADGSNGQALLTSGAGILSWGTVGSGTVTGSGSTGYLGRWTSSSALGNSVIYDDGTNVGIGTTAPDDKLHIENGATTVLKIGDGNKSTGFLYSAESPSSFQISTNRSGSTGVFEDTGAASALISLNSFNADSNIAFFTSATNNVTPTQRMTVDKNGNVGIGTTEPGAKLQVNADASGVGLIVRGNATTPGNMQVWQNSAGTVVAYIDSGGQLNIEQGGSLLMHRASGSALVFDIAQSGASDTTFRWYSAGNHRASLWSGLDTEALIIKGRQDISGLESQKTLIVRAGGSGQTGNLFEWQNSAGTGLGAITNAGNVGIGTTGPLTKLHVASANTTTQAVIATTDSAGNSGNGVALWSGWSGGTPNLPAIIWSNGEDLRFGGGVTDFAAGTGFSEAMRIQNSTGNVGIGTTGPGVKLDVAGTAGTDYARFEKGIVGGSTSGILRMYGDLEAAQGMFLLDSGNVGIGTTSPSGILDVSSTTSAFLPPRMTTTQRDAIASPTAGMVIYNSTTNKLNVYTTAWEAVTSG